MIAFGSDVDRLTDFTTDRAQLQQAVDALKPEGATRFYDAVAEALKMLDRESGRRVVLALTDGEDTFSQDATLESVIASGQRLGLPVYTLGLGTEEEIESGDLRRLATSTRGQYYPARNADELRAIYEQIAERIRSSYSMIYQSDRKLADGTLRPVRIFYRGSTDGGRRDGHLHSGHGGSGRRLVAAFSRAAVRAGGLDRAPVEDRSTGGLGDFAKCARWREDPHPGPLPKGEGAMSRRVGFHDARRSVSWLRMRRRSLGVRTCSSAARGCRLPAGLVR